MCFGFRIRCFDGCVVDHPMNHRRGFRINRISMFVLVVFLALGCGARVDDGSPIDRPARSLDSGMRLVHVIEVEGRQGIATDGENYFVSGSTELFAYSKSGELLLANRNPFAELEKTANHIGDIDVHGGEIYAGIEWFVDGRGTDIQVAIYDAETLEYRRSIEWEPSSGQVEVSAVAVDIDRNAIWMTDWVDGRHIYRYALDTGAYVGKTLLDPMPQRQQGIAAGDGVLFITADDGDAELDEADNLWRVEPGDGSASARVEHAHAFVEFRRSGEIEGVTFDKAAAEMIVLSNRGARIILGMPSGFYPGYDREIHELYVFAVGDP